MIIYYEKDGFANVEVYNGLLEFKKALETITPFEKSDNLALRSGELFMNLAGKQALVKFCDDMAMEIQASNMVEVYFAPTEGFISKEVMTRKIKSVLPDVDDTMCGLIMFSMYPDTFFGKFTEEQLLEEIQNAYKAVLEQLEEEE